MAHYVVETYLSRMRTGGFEACTAQMARAAEELRADGMSVRHLRSMFLAEDETCLHFVEAPSIDAVRAVSERAGIASFRIGPSVLSEAGGA